MIKPINTRIAATLLSALDWAAALNADYRQARKLENLTDDQLNDVGMSRADALGALHHAHSDGRARDRNRIPLSGPIASTRG